MMEPKACLPASLSHLSWEEPLLLATKPKVKTDPRKAQLRQAHICSDRGGKAEVARMPGTELGIVRCDLLKPGENILCCKRVCKAWGSGNTQSR